MKILSNFPSAEKLSKINAAKLTIDKSNENYELELSSSIRLISYYNEEIEKIETQIESI